MIELLLYTSLSLSLVSILCFVLRFTVYDHIQMRLSTGLALCSNLLLVIFSIWSYIADFSLKFKIGILSNSLQMVFLVDDLTKFFLLLIGIVSLGIIVYNYGYLEHYGDSTRTGLFLSLALLLIFSMTFLILSASVLAFMFWWELMAINTFVLILYFTFYDEKARISSLLYFIMTQMSSVLLFLVFFSLSKSSGSFEISALHTTNSGITQPTMMFILLFLAFGIKSGLVPFHKWLIYAHPEAPSGISALLSGITINLAVYGFLRFTGQLFPASSIHRSWSIVIIIAGLLSAFLGVIYALKEQDIKKMLAYSSVENIGIIYICLGLNFFFLSLHESTLAKISLGALFMHMLNHGIYKSLLFMSAGSVVQATQTRDSEKMGGLIKTMPRTSTFYLVGCMAISGFPPFNGFISELLLFKILILSNLSDFGFQAFFIIILSIFSLVSAMASVTFVKSFGTQFLAMPRSDNSRNAHEVNHFMLFGLAIPATLVVSIGLFSFQILSRFGIESDYPNILVIGIFLIIVYFLCLKFISLYSNSDERTTETWGCGILSQSSNMEYTPTGFSEPIMNIFSTIYRTKKPREITFFDPQNTILKEGKGEITLLSFFEEYLYFPAARFFLSVSTLVRKLYNNKTGSYIAYTLLGILSVFVILIMMEG